MSWQEELKKGLRRAEELAPILGWTPEETAERAAVAGRFPMMITPYYLSLVDPKDPDDPIGRMCIPSLDEFDPGGSSIPAARHPIPRWRASSTSTPRRGCC